MAWCVCVCVFAAPKNERWNRFENFHFFFFCCFHFFHLIPLLLPTIIVNGNLLSETMRKYPGKWWDEWERERGNKCVLLIIIHQLFSSNFLYFFGGWIWRICMNDKNYYSNDGNRFWCLIHERIYTWFLLLVVVWCEKQIIFAQQIWKAICS